MLANRSFREVRNANGIRIYAVQKETGGCVKVEWGSPYPPRTIKAFLEDWEGEKWDPFLEERKCVGNVVEGVKIVQEKYNTVLLKIPRDLLIAWKECPTDSGVLLLSVSFQHPDYPPILGVIRADLRLGGYHILPSPSGSTVTSYRDIDFHAGHSWKIHLKLHINNMSVWIQAFNQALSQFAARNRSF